MMNGVTPVLEFYIRPRIFAQQSWYSREAENTDGQESATDPTDDKEGEAEVSV
jgi:hypothetical protein